MVEKIRKIGGANIKPIRSQTPDNFIYGEIIFFVPIKFKLYICPAMINSTNTIKTIKVFSQGKA